jgi:hypothetical protein
MYVVIYPFGKSAEGFSVGGDWRGYNWDCNSQLRTNSARRDGQIPKNYIRPSVRSFRGAPAMIKRQGRPFISNSSAIMQ